MLHNRRDNYDLKDMKIALDMMVNCPWLDFRDEERMAQIGRLYCDVLYCEEAQSAKDDFKDIPF